MARYVGPACRLCRREGMKLFLKGERCYGEKCAIERRNVPPGQHGKGRRARMAGYGLQLREKQRVKRMYGVLESQFRRYFKEADRRKGVTGETLLQLLEGRLDNVVYRLGFAPSRPAARQLVSHKHFLVNDQIVNIPSFIVKPGDIVSVREKSRKMDIILESMRRIKGDMDLSWLSIDKAKMKGTFETVPDRDEMQLTVNEQLVVELYSK